MKKYIVFGMVTSFCIHSAQSQTTDQTRIYEVRSNIPAVPCDILGTAYYGNSFFAVPPYKARFAVIRSKNDSIVVRFLTWSDNDSLRKSFNDTLIHYIQPDNDSLVRTNRYFLVTSSDLDSNCIKVFATGRSSAVFTLGLVTMPMKLRLGTNFDFQGNLSLGTTAGVKVRMSKYNPNYFDVLFGASLSTVSLDSFNTSGKVAGQPLTNISVFSPSLGLVFEFGKAQAGFFLGWDFLNKSSQSKFNWIYNRKPWLSIGFGFSIFSIDSNNSNQDQYQSSSPPGS